MWLVVWDGAPSAQLLMVRERDHSADFGCCLLLLLLRGRRPSALSEALMCVYVCVVRCAGTLKLLPGMVAALNRDSSSPGERRDAHVPLTAAARSDDVRVSAGVHTERERVRVCAP